MVGAEIKGSTSTNNAYANGLVQINNGSLEEKLDELRNLLGKIDDDPLRIVNVGVGAWGNVFALMLQDGYGHLRDKVQIRIWRRAGRSVDRATSQHLFDVINSQEDVLRRLIRRCAYLKYVEARLGDREAVWDADIVINGLPSTETHQVFQEISKYWKERITVHIT
ncbi:glycerol-3-phosphate dehydrogenase [NAD(+)] GPDHC1, cytosolic [Lactuca sativa]|uniref:glycerol-3-phosphate dehydrogenase [NAD(+)] GPDHC1, cytosolic n=1 Tax=Lactuca sativa TaxID=4236 RepID=UPI000CD95562|nr:glycerol-3-phosphate dehydrogenase [NAD(+)] GPDHC1, cytosolic [Lactuca sativa]